MKRLALNIIVLILIMAQLPALCLAQLEGAYDAHGGLDTYKKQGTLEYDQSMELGGAINLSDHQLFDLNSRNVLITSDSYTIGFDGKEAWITPGAEALGIQPRFYALTPFYFFGLPFLFADEGANLKPLGTKELGGKEYDVVKVTFDKGVGDTPDDDYYAFIDKDTKLLKVATYIVTYPPLMQGKSVDELERHAAVYDEWQEVEGLTVPKKVVFYEWTDEKLSDQPRGFMTFENVTFKETSPDPSVFHKPQGAQVDNSHMSQ